MDSVLVLTDALRASDEPLFVRLRELLAERGVDPHRALLAALFSDDRAFEYGVVVTPERRVFQFGLDYLDRPLEEGEFLEWVDWTYTYPLAAFRHGVEAALRHLDRMN
jgi:hypothetical protein